MNARSIEDQQVLSQESREKNQVIDVTDTKQQQVLKEESEEERQLKKEYNDLEILLDQYNRSLTAKSCFLQDLENEKHILKTYLAKKEEAFSVLVGNYDKCKILIQKYIKTDDDLDKHYDSVINVLNKIEDKYNSLKKHASDEISKANNEMFSVNREYEMKIKYEIALFKELEITYNCVADTLANVTAQCSEMQDLIKKSTSKC